MRAVRIHGERDVRLENLPEPAIEPGTVLLTGGFTGICGTDLHLYFKPESLGEDFSSPATLTGATWPQILGHEFSGEVSHLGSDVGHLGVGDRVAVFPYHYCGNCLACRSDQYTSCEFMAFEGIHGHSGGMAQVKRVRADDCFVLPPSVDLKLGALVEPMAVGWHGVSLAAVHDGDSALIVGGGPIGVGVYFALKARGVPRVIVSEPSADRRAVLERIGVDHVIDPTAIDLNGEVRALTGGGGVAAAIDTAGAPRAFAGAMESLGIGGRMIIIAVYEEPIELHRSLLFGGRSIQNSSVYSREDYRAVIAAMSSGLYSGASQWIETVSFEQVENALHELRAGNGLKVLVETP